MSHMTFGQRLRAHRERAGKTRAVLGGLVGKSSEWVKGLETGRLQMPRMPMLIQLAHVLGINNLADLTGGESVPVAQFASVEHPAVPAIRNAVLRWTLSRPQNEPDPVSVLQERVRGAWRVWHGSATRRTDIGALLPRLIVDCQDAMSVYEGAERRAAAVVLTEVYHLTQHAIVNAAQPELLWMTVDRCMAAAQVADDPLTLGGASWTVGMVLRGAGRTEEALDLIHDATDLLEPRLSDAPDEWLAIWGALQLHGALTAGRAGAEGEAWAHFDRADQAARRLPDGYTQHWTMFCRANVDLNGAGLTVDLWKSREGLRRAESIDPDTLPSRERRGRLYVEMARGYYATDERVAAARMLELACDEGVDAVRYSPAARAIVEDLAKRPPLAIRRDIRTLEQRLGLDPF